LRQTRIKAFIHSTTTDLAKDWRLGLKWQVRVEIIRSRLIYKSLDAILTAPLRPRRSRPDYLETIFNWKSSNYERVAAWAKLVDSFFSGFAERASAGLTNSSRFPFGEAKVQLMSFGSGSTVFLLKRPDSDWVLKVYRRSLGKKAQSLEAITGHFKGKYETVCSWYNGRCNLVPPAHFLILHGPILSSPAAAVLQPYIHGRKSDFFLDYSNQDLLLLMRKEPELAEQFCFFTEQTLCVYTKHDLCVDFLGRENLMLVEKDGRHQLLVVDNGIFHMSALQDNVPEVYGQVKTRLERLQYLQRALA
jgi:hypothetical protein